MKKNLVLLVPAVALLMLAAGCGYRLGPRPAATKMDTPVARSSWQFGNIPGEQLDSEHYRIFTTSKNPAMLDYLPGFMEASYGNYLDITGLKPTRTAKAMPIYMFATRAQWAVMTERDTRPHQQVYLSIENGGYCYRGVCVFWDMQHPATFAIAAHEGLHQLFQHQLRDRLPAWVEEGLCVLTEGTTIERASVRFHPDGNGARLQDLRRALSGGRYIKLERLLSTDAGDHISKAYGSGPEYYGHLWALLNYIRSDPQTAAGLQRLVADAAAGRLRAELNVPPALSRDRDYNRAMSLPIFKHYISKDLPTFEAGFRTYARKLAKLD